MADFPSAIFEPRTVANKPGTVYDPDDETIDYAEDYQYPAEEIVAIEETLGTDPQGSHDTVGDRLTAIETSALNSLAASWFLF